MLCSASGLGGFALGWMAALRQRFVFMIATGCRGTVSVCVTCVGSAAVGKGSCAAGGTVIIHRGPTRMALVMRWRLGPGGVTRVKVVGSLLLIAAAEALDLALGIGFAMEV